MSGLFYELETNRRFPLTLYFLESVAKISESDPDLSAEEVIRQSLRQAGLQAKAKSEDVEYALVRMQEIKEEVQGKKEEEGGDKSDKQSLGTDFMKWLSDFRSEEICMFIAGFDSLKAREIYRGWDRDEVTKASRMLYRYEWERLKAQFEASMYGFGGGYGGGSKTPGNHSSADGNTKVYDLTQDNPEGLAALEKALRGG